MSDSQRADGFMHQLWLAEKCLRKLGFEYNGKDYVEIKKEVVDRFTKPKKNQVQNFRCNGYCSDPSICGGGCYEY